MRFLYKINSGYDGFTPARIPERLVDSKFLRLGWKRYVDAVEKGDHVWIYFKGPHRFEDGLYAKCVVSSIDFDKREVLVRVRESSAASPLSDREESHRVGLAVSTWYQQVFLLPEEWLLVEACDVATTARSCAQRLCENCKTWKTFPKIQSDDFALPSRLRADVVGFYPGFWVIPSRCFISSEVKASIRRTSEIFYRLKTGDANVAFTLAAGVFEVLKRERAFDFDCIIPVPLSPDKAKAGEIHRTRLLANELADMLEIPVDELITLSGPISKRRMLASGYSVSNFRNAYDTLLRVNSKIKAYDKVLVVDDVSTEGTTLSCIVSSIHDAHPECEVSAATAGQMIVKHVVRNVNALISD